MLNGTLHPDFASVATTLTRILPAANQPGGAAVCVYHRGQKVVDAWGGTRDANGSPWQADTISTSFSTTKGVASTLLHICIDRGLVDIDTPVAEYWPEFGANGKSAITVRHVMCHESGLYGIADHLEHASEMLDWDRMIQCLSDAKPRHAPGEAHGYHALSYGFLVGEIARRVLGGKPFTELLENEIARPLGLGGLYCGVPVDQQHRCAELYAGGLTGSLDERLRTSRVIRDRAAALRRFLSFLRIAYDPGDTIDALAPPGIEELDFNSESFRAASIPAANGMFTARSLARMYACLAGGGELNGVRLMSPTAVRRAASEQNRGVGRVVPISMRWRLGYHRVFTMGAKIPQGFGHFGFGGSGGWADPQRNLAVALVVNSGVGSPFGDSRIVRIGDAAARCADRRGPGLLAAPEGTELTAHADGA